MMLRSGDYSADRQTADKLIVLPIVHVHRVIIVVSILLLRFDLATDLYQC